jgi:ABC-type enterochelin transport system ATPase subunit
VYLGRLRGGVDPRVVDELAERLDLDLGRRLNDLSKGNKQKAGVIAAFMHDPRLLILDEPTSGLDPLRQQDVLDLIRERAAAGRTVGLRLLVCMASTPFIDAYDGAHKRLATRKAPAKCMHTIVHTVSRAGRGG